MSIYLDTSCLVRRAELKGPNPTARTQHAAPPVVSALRQSTGEIATSEVGLIEFHDVATGLWRDVNPPNTTFDEAWCESVIDEAMADVEVGRLTILPLPPRAFEQAMTLVTMSTRQFGRKFRMWDAIHLITAIAWSRERGGLIELWTTDEDYEGFVGLYPHFGNLIRVVNLDK